MEASRQVLLFSGSVVDRYHALIAEKHCPSAPPDTQEALDREGEG
jgi:hypothetical protein